MEIKNIGKNYLEKNKTSPLLKPPEKDFHLACASSPTMVQASKFGDITAQLVLTQWEILVEGGTGRKKNYYYFNNFSNGIQKTVELFW